MHKFLKLIFGIKLCMFRKVPLYDIYQCCVYSENPLMMDRGTFRNMQSFIPKISLRNLCI